MHAVESMMYVREVPWHGLGYKFEEAPKTIEAAIKAAGLDWEVFKKQAEVKVNGHHIPIVGCNAVYRKRSINLHTLNGEPVEGWDTMDPNIRDAISNAPGYEERAGSEAYDILGTVGDRYRILQNQRAFEHFQPFLDQGVEFETAGSLFEGKKVWILANTGDPIEIAKNDNILRYILLSHAHDGTAAISFGLTPTRVVCNNTLSMAVEDNRSKLLKFKHTANADRALEIAAETLSLANQQFETTAKQYKLLAKASVGKKAIEQLESYCKLIFDINEEKLKEGGKAATRWENTFKQIQEIWECAPGQQRQSWWDMYNVLTYWYSHKACRTAENRLASLWWGLNATKSSKALSTALDLASK